MKRGTIQLSRVRGKRVDRVRRNKSTNGRKPTRVRLMASTKDFIAQAHAPPASSREGLRAQNEMGGAATRAQSG
jgi:hypothetical protein